MRQDSFYDYVDCWNIPEAILDPKLKVIKFHALKEYFVYWNWWTHGNQEQWYLLFEGDSEV